VGWFRLVVEREKFLQWKKFLAVIGVIILAQTACVPDTDGGHEGWADSSVTWDAGVDSGRDATVRPDATWQPPTNSRVYVNTQDSLFYIDPGQSDELVLVGKFTGPCTEGSGFYDIALDQDRRMIGIAQEGLYWIDTDTAECTYAFQFPPDSPRFFALSYVKGVDSAHPDKDELIGASGTDGEWVLIDFPGEAISDVFIHLGYYDPGFYRWRSSGDIVSFQVGPNQYKTYATVRCEAYTDPPSECDSDWLVEVDPENGQAHPIGKTGFQQIYGLGFWGDRLYGFTNCHMDQQTGECGPPGGDYITIDLQTGAGTLKQHFDSSFWGAGNTTRPYVVE